MYSYENILKTPDEIPSAICTPRDDMGDTSLSEDDAEDDYTLVTDHAATSKMIRITRPMRIRWDMLTMILALWNAIWVPIDISFVKAGETYEFAFILSTVTDC